MAEHTTAKQQADASFDIRIYYEDTDAGGLVYHANYIKFYERARTEMLRAIGIEQDTLLAEQIAFVVKSIKVDNLVGVTFNALLNVKTRVEHFSRTSICFSQWIEEDNKVVNRAEFVIVSVDLTKMKPVRLPQKIVEVLNSVS